MQQGTPTWNEPQILIVTPPLNKHGIGHHTGFSIALDAEHGLLAQFSYRSPKSGTQFISRHFLYGGPIRLYCNAVVSLFRGNSISLFIVVRSMACTVWYKFISFILHLIPGILHVVASFMCGVFHRQTTIQ